MSVRYTSCRLVVEEAEEEGEEEEVGLQKRSWEFRLVGTWPSHVDVRLYSISFVLPWPPFSNQY